MEPNGLTEPGIAATIRERRTIRVFNGEPLEEAEVLGLLRDAVWAPYHSAREPWRFILFMGEGRRRFADAVKLTYPEETLKRWGAWAENQYCRLMQAHLLVVIEADPRQKYWEDAFSAAAALIQNIQLLAWERRIGVVWKTNEYNWDPAFHRAVGVQASERIVGTLHLGYFDSAKTPRPKPRAPLETLLNVVRE